MLLLVLVINFLFFEALNDALIEVEFLRASCLHHIRDTDKMCLRFVLTLNMTFL